MSDFSLVSGGRRKTRLWQRLWPRISGHFDFAVISIRYRQNNFERPEDALAVKRFEKKGESLTDSVSDNLKSNDASASKKFQLSTNLQVVWAARAQVECVETVCLAAAASAHEWKSPKKKKKKVSIKINKKKDNKILQVI